MNIRGTWRLYNRPISRIRIISTGNKQPHISICLSLPNLLVQNHRIWCWWWWCIFLQQYRIHINIGNSKNYLGMILMLLPNKEMITYSHLQNGMLEWWNTGCRTCSNAADEAASLASCWRNCCSADKLAAVSARMRLSSFSDDRSNVTCSSKSSCSCA